MAGVNSQTLYECERLSLRGVVLSCGLARVYGLSLVLSGWHGNLAMKQVWCMHACYRAQQYAALLKPQSEAFCPLASRAWSMSQIKGPRCSRVRRDATGTWLWAWPTLPNLQKHAFDPFIQLGQGGYCLSRFRGIAFGRPWSLSWSLCVTNVTPPATSDTPFLNSNSIRIGQSWDTHFWHHGVTILTSFGARKVAESGYHFGVHFWRPF